jgi:protein-tyrosine phosphatase
MIELHCHVLPGVDDGAADGSESGVALGRMYEQGVRQVIVTPHVNSSFLLRPKSRAVVSESLDEAWVTLLAVRDANFPDLALHRGSELMLDHPQPDLSFDWVRLAGTRFVLVEFPGMSIPPRAADALAGLVASGYVPVIAHPERYWNAGPECADAVGWRSAGARLQVNCGSLLGQYGREAARRARHLLRAGAVDYLASDYHARGEYPVEQCRRVFTEEGCGDQSELLLCTNPARLLEGENPLDVPPVALPESKWQRLPGIRRFWPMS